MFMLYMCSIFSIDVRTYRHTGCIINIVSNFHVTFCDLCFCLWFLLIEKITNNNIYQKVTKYDLPSEY